MDEPKRTAATVGAGGKSHARITLAKRGVDPKTIMSKLIGDRRQGSGGPPNPNSDSWLGPGTMMSAYDTSGRISSDIEDIENLKKLNPELDLAMQIQIALILSPKDFINLDINYSLRPGILPSEMADGMLDVMKNFHQTSYNIKAKLPKLLERSLYVEGAVAWAVIPENSLDDLINGRVGSGSSRMTLESLRSDSNARRTVISDLGKPLGFLGTSERLTAGKMTLESILGADPKEKTTGHTDGYGELKCSVWENRPADVVMPVIYDNPNILKLPRLMQALSNERLVQAMESIGGAGVGGMRPSKQTSEALAQYFKDAPAGSFPMLAMPTIDNATREAIGQPLTLQLPTESVIPIFEPGNPEKHIGYYVILDENGSPVTRHGSLGYYRNLYSTVDGGENSKLSGLLRQAAQDETDFQDYRKLARQREALQTYQDATIAELEARASNGNGMRNLSLSTQSQAYQIMLARSLSSMQTRILYLPADMVVYWAYDFNEDGTGRSVIENIKTISGMRALTLMSNLEAQVRNSVDHNTLDITIDPRDPNPQKTRDMIINGYVQRAGTTIPWASGNPRTMAEWLAMRGTNINVSGGANYPETKVEVVARDVALRDVNMDFDESLGKREMMGIGISPELVDLTTQIEFSSKMATSNDLSTKRATVLSDQTNRLMKKDLQTHITNSKPLKDQLIAVIGRHSELLTPAQRDLGEAGLLYLFMAYLEVELPKPSNGLRQKTEDYNEFIEGLDKILDDLFDEEMFTDAEGGNPAAQDANQAKQVKALLRTQAVIDYCRNNNYMTEIIDMIDIDEDDSVGTMFAKEALMTNGRLSHMIKSLGLKLAARTMISNNQWTALRQELMKFSFKGDGTGDAPEGGGSSSYDGGDVGGSGGDDDFFMDDEPANDDLNQDDQNNDDNQENQEEEEESGQEGNTGTPPAEETPPA